ncbi:phosphatase PAP2 family protein [Caldimonas tepidiphila]|uniref:phosphatase PAP2 family protein n=1 Tax=Caldimonas tepidiphila TaxID=2315841 RepID=UPI000E5A78ED|nr:phosphatase PAP2 family protein [Caldimonas tepidiphila]
MKPPAPPARSAVPLPQQVLDWLRRRALTGSLLLGLLALGAAALFVELAEDVMEGDEFALDRMLLLALREPADPADPIGPWWFDLMMADFTALGSTPVVGLVWLFATSHLLVLRKWGTALMVGVSVGGGMLLTYGLKRFIERPRPDLVPHAVDVLTLSFPSGHATMSAVVYLTLGALLASLQRTRRARLHAMAVAATLTVLVGASRVYLGVHWPSDVLAGWALGTAWALLCLLGSQWLRRHVLPAGQRDAPAAGAD